MENLGQEGLGIGAGESRLGAALPAIPTGLFSSKKGLHIFTPKAGRLKEPASEKFRLRVENLIGIRLLDQRLEAGRLV